MTEHPCQCGGGCGLTYNHSADSSWRRRKYAASCPVMKERRRLRVIARGKRWRDAKRANGTLKSYWQKWKNDT